MSPGTKKHSGEGSRRAENTDLELCGPGMRAQLVHLAEALERGMPRAGWKVGLNFPEIRARVGLVKPALAWLNGNRVLGSGCSYAAAPEAKIHIEAELCIRLATLVPAGSSADRAEACIASIAPALELVDYSKSWKGITAILEHSMFHEACVLGAESERPELDGLVTSWPRLFVDGGCVREPRHDLRPLPLGELVAFVANTLGDYTQGLQAGDLIMSGSFIDPFPLDQGATAIADFAGLGSVSVTLSGS